MIFRTCRFVGLGTGAVSTDLMSTVMRDAGLGVITIIIITVGGSEV